MIKKILSITVCVITLSLNSLFGQNSDYDKILGQEQELNAITTSVPFLMIAPDSRSGAMGDAGVALSPNGYSQHWNSSKLAFIEKSAGATISYTPWLKELVDDMSLAYVTGYYKLDKLQTIGGGLRYFSMGNIIFTDGNGDVIGNYAPNEFAVDGSYNRKLSDQFALGILGRFIYSNLTGGQGYEGSKAGTSVAIDINGFYTNKMELAGYEGNWAAGFNVSNIGAKLGYSEDTKNFIPTNLRIGGAMTLDLDSYNSITATMDINKLLIPTPPIHGVDSVTGEEIFLAGKDSDVGITQGIIQSFYDAPRGFEEEMEELSYAIGVEYWYAKQFAVRAGYFYEHQNKGNRKYFTAGVGLKMNVFGLDFSYLIPAGNFTNSPLSNTWRFSLIFDLDDFNNQ
ncbi:MAG: type IX secretion system outer membrane channel protein PorV [Salinivirgaceae bacterium]|jgi:hypothetical protein|nr:type IX secretion system outer membrane channel protein PorV [Salinivirgaceae bacterium]